MKTSNKILLGVFITGILLTTAVNLVVFAKYKRGDYVPFKSDAAEYMSTVRVPATRFVSIIGLGGVELINSDTARYEIQKNKGGKISYRMVNDTLVILGDSTLGEDQMKKGILNYQQFKLYLPAGVQLHAAYSEMTIRGSTDTTKAPSFNIHLENHSFFNMGEGGRERTYINQLQLSSDQSNSELRDRLVINELNCKLANGSKIDTRHAEIRKLTLDIDDASTINLSGNSMKAIK
jgi:hypothetical protein